MEAEPIFPGELRAYQRGPQFLRRSADIRDIYEGAGGHALIPPAAWKRRSAAKSPAAADDTVRESCL